MFLCAVTRISGAVLQVLLPIMNDIKDDLSSVKDDLSSVKRDLASLNESVSKLSGDIENHKNQTTSDLVGLKNILNISITSHTEQIDAMRDTLDSQLVSVNTSMREELRVMESQLEEHKNQTTSELVRLENVLNISTASHTEQIDAMRDTLNSQLVSVNTSMREELRAMESQLEEHKNQTTSELADLHTSLQSSINNTHAQQMTQLCDKLEAIDTTIDNTGVSMRADISCIKEDLSSLNDSMNRISDNVEEHEDRMTTELMKLDRNLQRNFACGGTGGWRRVVYLDMTDLNTNCPSGWQLTRHSKRTCGRVSTGTLTCDSVTFPVSGGDYTRVCGRIKAYQYSVTDAFEAYDDGLWTTIDGAYVSGVSLTHGSPRQHIWTFAAGRSEDRPTYDDACPCDATIDITIPPFVGGDYFCESGYPSRSVNGFYPDDPLWDGKGCSASSTCCSFNSLPYFTKQLPSPTTDDIEARICLLDAGDDTPIEFIELYVQ